MPFKKILQFTCVALIFFAPFFVSVPHASSDELETISKQLDDLNDALNKSVASTKPLQSQLEGMQKQVAGIKQEVVNVEADMALKRKEISNGYKNLGETQKTISATIREFYIKSYYDSPLLVFFSQSTASDVTQALAYQRVKTQQDRAKIMNLALSITDLEDKKTKLEQEEKWLTTTKASLDEQSAKLDKVVAGAKDYQSKLSSQIAQLSAQQQNLIASKLAGLNIPRSAGTSARGCSSDLTNGKNPGFSPRLGFFTYGAPHRNGLNQYGALGRAKAGQNEEQILQAYYPGMTLKKDYDQGIQISTTTGWSGSIEDYVKRIYEVPDSWIENNLAVLKSQAVAARTYALRSTSNGANQICTTESCQVFKPEPKGGNWEQAVEATKGWVLMDGGSLGFTQYASTHGGYILNLGKFDGSGTTPSSFAELNERAYDKESPWFYCNWGSRSEYAGTAWLKTAEVADIANVIMLVKRDSGVSDKLYQPDKPHPEGREVWSPDRVRQELQSRGGSPLSTATDVSVGVDFGSGKTTSININGNSFEASEFKNWFNLRAPANIQIVGPLYNVEKQ